METLERLLLEHPFLAGIEPRLGRELVGCVRNLRFEQDQYLFREAGAADTFYLIREGQVALELYVPGRQPMVIVTLGAGEMVGSSWLVPPYRWGFDARAMVTTRAFGLDAVCLRAKCESDHDLGYDMMKRVLPILARRMQAARQQLLDVYAGPTA
jgi:CRP/FNR family transcriptional regulator, cyclic AMP receptor protein